MDEDDNVNLSNEEQIKHKKKGAKSVVAESARVGHKGGKEKKKTTKKSKGVESAEADTKNGGGLKIDNAERDGESSRGLTMDNGERKRKRREKKDRNETEEVKREESTKGESVSGKESAKEVMERKKKKQKVKTNDNKVGEKDGEVIRGDSENCIGNAAEIMKETKNKKKRKGDSFVGAKDIHNQSNCDEVGLSSKQQENAPHHVEDRIRSTKEDGGERKKKKKHKKKVNYEDGLPADQQEDGLSSKRQENALPQSTKEDADTKTNRERKKNKKHKKKENCKDGLPAAQQEDEDNDTNGLLNTKETENNEVVLTNKRKKKKAKVLEDGSNGERHNKAEYTKKGKKRKASFVAKGSNDNSPNKSNKKVRFSDKDEVFPAPPKSNTENRNGKEDNLIRGKRFTRQEDEILKDAVMQYIEDHELGDEGVEMILNCGKHPELKGCWKEIASSLPYRPHRSIYFRGRILLMRSESRKWTQEEYDMLLKHQEVHGNKWKPLAEKLGKHAWHVGGIWRQIKLRGVKKGRWSQQEYQGLFNLVNLDLQLKFSEEKKSRHGMLRDNIAWTAISDKLSTRPQSACCEKWYRQLTSPMVVKGLWADSDDYRLLSALYSLDATCMEDVEWDDLIKERAGDLCRKRWNQMVQHLGHNGNKSFAEQVEVLTQRYCPHLLEAREIWDNKPRVP